MRFGGEKREVKKELILDATFRCVSKYGIDGVRLSAIAKEAKINQALLHYYFGDKKNLLAEFIQYLYGRFIEYVEAEIDPDIAPEKQVEALLQAARKFLSEQNELFVVFIDVWSFCLRRAALKKSYASIYKRLVGFIENILNQVLGQETSSKISTEALSYHFAALVVGTGALWHMDNRSLDIESQLRVFKETLESILLQDRDASLL